MNDTEALQALQEIPLPPPISYRPQTWGWLVLLIIVIAIIAALIFSRWRAYQTNRYRREALIALSHIEIQLRDSDTRVAGLRELPVLIKRTALSATARVNVAALSGDDWLRFLENSIPKRNQFFSDDMGKLLWRCAYADSTALNSTTKKEIDSLCRFLRVWIGRHAAF
jgi:hypothetical protein